MSVVDVAVIGAGPAGAAAAVQLKRSGVRFRMFDKTGTGGLLRNADRVENYPGFPRGITGPALVRLMAKHLANLGIKVEKREILRVEYRNGLFCLKTRGGNLRARVCVMATGTDPLRLSDRLVSSEASDLVFYEAVPLGRSKDKRIAVVGGGDTAFDYALNLSRRNDVFLILRSRAARCLPLLRRRAERRPRISILDGAKLKMIRRTKRGLCLDLGRGRRKITLEVSCLLAAVGRKPSLEVVGQSLKKRFSALRRAGRLYLIGDVKNGSFRQTVIAAGDGVRAAMEILHGEKGPGR